MVSYTVKDELQRAVEKMQELQCLIDELQPVMPNADHHRLADLTAEIAALIARHNSCILREDKAHQ
jgi:hypothetical protein